MRRKLVTFALAVGVGVGAGGAALLTPALATAQSADQDTGSAPVAPGRVERLKEALRGLVTDGTLTQEQADEVAATLADRLPAHGPGGRGHGRGHGHGHAGRLAPEAVAEALGVTVEELRTARQSGKTLAQIAQDEGISRGELVDRLVAASKAQLAEDVEAGRLTQEQSDRLQQELEARIGERVDRTGPPFGRGRGHGPHGERPRDTAPENSATPGS